MSKFENPMQPLVMKDKIRFKENEIVSYLLNHGGLDMNKLSVECRNASQDDWQQFYQLIGYSLNGYSELRLVSDKSYNKACKKAEKIKE